MTLAAALFASSVAAATPARPVLQVDVVTASATVRGTCVLVHRERRDTGVALYFVTAARLFRTADGDRAALRTVTLTRADATVEIAPADVMLPAASVVDVAVLKATVARSDLAPVRLSFDPPETGSTFHIATLEREVVERVRFQSTLIATGERDASAVGGCVGAPAIGAAGIFGVVSECGKGRGPVIALLAIARPFIAQQIPALPIGGRLTSLNIRERTVAGPNVLIGCGPLDTGAIDVPLDSPPEEVPIFATAEFVHAEALHVADVRVVALDRGTVKLRFTLGGAPVPPFGTTCQPGQALVSVRVNVVLERDAWP
jgi:hypothetical protein